MAMVPFTYETLPTGVTSAADNKIVLNAPARGTIRRLMVTQLGGTLAGFEYAIYEADAAFTAGAPNANAERYRVTPKVTVSTVATGADAAIFGVDYPFSNRDGEVGEVVSAYEKQRLYLWLKPAGTGAKNFAVDLLIEHPDL